MVDRTEQEPAAGASPVGSSAARGTRSRFEPARALELYALLETTFLPGALLLVISAPNGAGLRPPEETTEEVDPQAEQSRDAIRPEIEKARSRVRDELKRARAQIRSGQHPDPIDAAILIGYVEKLPHKSPRVVYNLACYYSLASDAEHRHDHLEVAFEYLRQSISRTPPLERRGLLEHARVDPDLLALRRGRARRRKFRQLWQLIAPEGERRARTSNRPSDGA